MNEQQSSPGRADAAWSQYWRGGSVASFKSARTSGYGHWISDHWALHIKSHGGQRVLDLATGNGALLALLGSMAQHLKLELERVGIDRAAIGLETTPAQHQAALRGAKLVGEAELESMPFNARQFDWVVSQFGIEYADADATLAEVARVLKPGGKVDLVMHADDSPAVENARQTIAAIEQLQQADGVLALARRLVKRIGNELGRPALAAWRRNTEAENLRTRLNDALDAVYRVERPALDDDFYHQGIQRALTALKPEAGRSRSDRLAYFDLVAAEIDGLRWRLTALSQAALAEDALDDWLKLASGHGLKLRYRDRNPYAHLIGLQFEPG